MELFTKHVDTVIILSAFAASTLWMNGKFNDIDKRFSEMDRDFVIAIKKYIAELIGSK
jgi:hypothetical protein